MVQPKLNPIRKKHTNLKSIKQNKIQADFKAHQKSKTIGLLIDRYGLKEQPAEELTIAICKTGKDFRKQIFFFGGKLRSNQSIRDRLNNGTLTIDELLNYDFNRHEEVKKINGPIVGATACPQCDDLTLVVDLIRKPSMGKKCEYAYKRQCLNTSCRFISIV